MSSYYPWQQGQWQQLCQRRNSGTLPHALLLAGQAGLGKRRFAEVFAQATLCEQPNISGEACNHCKSCCLFIANHHPDFTLVAPESEDKPIKIDQIRALIQFMVATTQISQHKVALIVNAETMNQAAANALLKTLEEPEGLALIILTCNAAGSLPATIRSRCQLVHFPPVFSSNAAEWLKTQLPEQDTANLLNLAEGSPLKALSLIDKLPLRQEILTKLIKLAHQQLTVTSLVVDCQKIAVSELLIWLIQLVNDCIKITLVKQRDGLLDKPLLAELQKLVSRAKLAKLYAYLDELMTLRQYLLANANLNQQLLIERLIYQWKLCWTDDL